MKSAYLAQTMLLSVLLVAMTACGGTSTQQPLKPQPYTYITPPEPRGDDTHGGSNENYVPPTRNTNATPFPQY